MISCIMFVHDHKSFPLIMIIYVEIVINNYTHFARMSLMINTFIFHTARSIPSAKYSSLNQKLQSAAEHQFTQKKAVNVTR